MATARPALEDVRQKWTQLAPLIDRMMERVGQKDEFPVAAGSSLAGDDKAAAPYHVSHVLRMCLTAGVDHLHAVKVLVVDQGVLHVAAPSSLARGALENFGAATWILGPSGRDERVERALRWHAKNFKDGDKVWTSLQSTATTPLVDKLEKLYVVGRKRGIADGKIKSGYTSTEAVQYSEGLWRQDLPLGVVLPWQLCSGFAHGRPWAYLGASELTQTPQGQTDIVDVRLSSSEPLALYPNLAAVQLLEKFLRLYKTRAEKQLV